MDGDIFARGREGRKERKKGRRGKVSAFFPRLRPHLASIFYLLPPSSSSSPRVWCFIGERSRELFPFCYRYLPLPPPPDEINDGINDTALNIGDQPVSQPDSMGEDRFAYLPAKVSRRSIYLPLPSLCLSFLIFCVRLVYFLPSDSWMGTLRPEK